jgi:hypothetical protein
MSRKRQLPPNIAEWPEFKNLSHDARLVYLLLYTKADDQGRVREDVGVLVFELFPGETGFGQKFEHCLREMEREQLIGRYDVKQVSCLVLSRWHDTQKIAHPTRSKLPPPPETRALFCDELALARAKRDHEVGG